MRYSKAVRLETAPDKSGNYNPPSPPYQGGIMVDLGISEILQSGAVGNRTYRAGERSGFGDRSPIDRDASTYRYRIGCAEYAVKVVRAIRGGCPYRYRCQPKKKGLRFRDNPESRSPF